MKLELKDLVVGELYQFVYKNKFLVRLDIQVLDVVKAMKQIDPLPLGAAKLSPMLYLGTQDIPNYKTVHVFLGAEFITGNVLVCGLSNPCEHSTCNLTKL